MSSSAIGLARLPRALRDLLDEQARTLSAAATALETLTRDPSRGARLTDRVDAVHGFEHGLAITDSVVSTRAAVQRPAFQAISRSPFSVCHVYGLTRTKRTPSLVVLRGSPGATCTPSL